MTDLDSFLRCNSDRGRDVAGRARGKLRCIHEAPGWGSGQSRLGSAPTLGSCLGLASSHRTGACDLDFGGG